MKGQKNLSIKNLKGPLIEMFQNNLPFFPYHFHLSCLLNVT